MNKLALAQATIIALLAAGLLFQGHHHNQTVRHYQQAVEQTAQHTINCIPVDDIMDAAEYNSILERVGRVGRGLSADFYGDNQVWNGVAATPRQ